MNDMNASITPRELAAKATKLTEEYLELYRQLIGIEKRLQEIDDKITEIHYRMEK